MDEQEPRGGWRRSTVEMNSIPWSPVLRYATPLPMNRTSVSTVAQHKSVSSVLRYATPLPMNRTPVSTVALQHKSVSSVLRYATPLPINRTPVSTVGGLFPPFCGTPHPSRSAGPHSEVGGPFPLLRYARPRFHRLFRPSPPDEHDHAFRSDPAGWLPMNTTTTLSLRSDQPCTRALAVRMRE